MGRSKIELLIQINKLIDGSKHQTSATSKVEWKIWAYLSQALKEGHEAIFEQLP